MWTACTAGGPGCQGWPARLCRCAPPSPLRTSRPLVTPALLCPFHPSAPPSSACAGAALPPGSCLQLRIVWRIPPATVSALGAGAAPQGLESGAALNVYERSRPTAPAELTRLGRRLLGAEPW